jgi:hypothetical protein
MKNLKHKTTICSRCNFRKPARVFNNSRGECRDCQAANALARRNTIKTFLRKLKARMRCVHCGLKDARVLEFDHWWNPDSKKFDLSGAVRKRVSLETFKAELRKTIVCCANCHRIATIECVL